MDKKNKYQAKIGDWVKLKSSKGELISGYIEKEANEEDFLQLRVVASENQLILGQSIRVQMHKVKKQKDSEYYSVGELKQLIDLALLTNDKAWFDSLMKKYQKLKVEQK